jgi:GNAT superfamily N-acetyltransferase
MEGIWRIELDADDDRAYAALAADSVWNGYSIGDLAPPFRAYAQVALAERGDAAAACLVLRHPHFTSIVPAGDPAGVAAILAAVDLPATGFVLVRPEHRAAIEQVYAFTEEPQPMLRMGLAAPDFHPTPGWERLATRQTAEHLDALAALYAGNASFAFIRDLLVVGPLYAVWVDGAPVAAAATHTMSLRYGAAAVGAVFTRADQRGHGYASAATSAVAADLLAQGCRLVLNVAEANAAARAIYTRLGFRDHCAYVEGTVRRRV